MEGGVRKPSGAPPEYWKTLNLCLFAVCFRQCFSKIGLGQRLHHKLNHVDWPVPER